MDNRAGNVPYTYADAGFNGFLHRSIDTLPAGNLRDVALRATQMPRTINFDQQQVGGALGNVIKVGSITIDGTNGRISVYDGTNEVVRIGELDG